MEPLNRQTSVLFEKLLDELVREMLGVMLLLVAVFNLISLSVLKKTSFFGENSNGLNFFPPTKSKSLSKNVFLRIQWLRLTRGCKCSIIKTGLQSTPLLYDSSRRTSDIGHGTPHMVSKIGGSVTFLPDTGHQTMPSNLALCQGVCVWGGGTL